MVGDQLRLVRAGTNLASRSSNLCMQLLRSVVAMSAVALAACGGTGDTVDGEMARLQITALAGPVCPLATEPPSPECALKPVDSATIVVTDVTGDEVARGTTGSDGLVGIDVAPGLLTLVPQPVEGLLGTASTISVTLTAGQTLHLTLDYDTGIR